MSVDTPLVLASASEIRAQILRAAGVATEPVPARVDEASVKAAMLADGQPPRNIADALAELKAQKISQKLPGALVLGADQVLVFDGMIFDKPQDLNDAREQLRLLRGNKHVLLSAAVICLDGQPIFRHIGTARMLMRPFSDAFLENYVTTQKDELLTSVGGYKLEKEGAQLFQMVDGDYFSVLGLPLLQVLGFLRARGMLIE